MAGSGLRGLLQVQVLFQNPRVRVAKLLDAFLGNTLLDQLHLHQEDIAVVSLIQQGA